MTFDVEEFRKYLVIDKNALDDEVIQQPTLVCKVAEAYVEAAALRDACKEAVATIDAQIDVGVREELEGEKITETIVRNRVQTHQAHKEAWDAYLTAKYEADVLGALKDAFVNRGFMLRDMVQLAVIGYFDVSSIKGTKAASDFAYHMKREILAKARDDRRSE